MFTNNILVLAAALAGAAEAFVCEGPYFSFYNRAGTAMSYQRLDPALFPGTESPHLHSFDGGNGLSALSSFADTQSSSCTTARIKPDKSLYWRPTLFFKTPRSKFIRVPEKFSKVYYKFGDGNSRANVTEFPEDFSMMAGSPFKRQAYDNPGRIRWTCLGEGYSRTGDKQGFPEKITSCKEGLATEITFPSCWNGKKMDPKSPNAHVAYPSGGGKGVAACPSTHQAARFPEIFIEFWYDVSSFDGQYTANEIPWVLSNGDPTGFGFHADFKNGWEKGVLAKATAETGYCNCGCGCDETKLKVCFGDSGVNDNTDASFKSCSATAAYAGGETSTYEKLPGCNPLQIGPNDAVSATGEGCNAAPAPASSYKASSAAPSASGKASSALPSLSISLAGKKDAYKTPDNYEIATPTLASSATPVTTPLPVSLGPNPSLGLVFSDEATNPPSSKLLPTASPSKIGECKAPVYVTVTPTVYVTAGAVANTTSCDYGTVTTTTTNTVTVTVAAGGSYRHKRHGHKH
ncbi:hypothetical protein B0J11DRAFT_103716 [Dendryphion nanum]|uniref:DUF1996 domain-containing protein n=1 Tax=Dendryphion nanum TaxID=256645 RepID=A0A9P9IEX6_9PLEO|nr:hypothetical protein B0J11DRAFT_103716 [Dendryphion nanum]